MRAMAHGLFGNRLLVVDADPSVGRLVKRVGESVGFEVIATEDPAVFATTSERAQRPARCRAIAPSPTMCRLSRSTGKRSLITISVIRP